MPFYSTTEGYRTKEKIVIKETELQHKLANLIQ